MDREKIIKMLLILVAIVVIAGGLSRAAQYNSLSLSEYAEKRSQEAQDAGTAGDADTGQDTASSKPGNSQEPTDTAPTEPPDSVPPESSSPLIGATLNGMLGAGEEKPERITYQESFYYEPLSLHLCRYITGFSYPAEAGEEVIPYGELRYVHILHYDFEGNVCEGEMICNQGIAQDLVEIFYELYRNEYQLERVLLIEEYDGDGLAAREDNNTFCFHSPIEEDEGAPSLHGKGLAVDVNPLYNPSVTYNKDGSGEISPTAAKDYADRSASFPYKIDETDLCYRLFVEHGFTWGGNRNADKDYQHFQKR